MKHDPSRPQERVSASDEIDAMIASTDDWRGKRLAELRAVIRGADPEVVEEVKWRKPSNPDGVPVWSHNGIVCIGNTLKRSVRLTFPKGAEVPDPRGLFNSRLDSASVRAIDSFEGDRVSATALTQLIRAAVRLNAPRAPAAVRARRRSTSPSSG